MHSLPYEDDFEEVGLNALRASSDEPVGLNEEWGRELVQMLDGVLGRCGVDDIPGWTMRLLRTRTGETLGC